MFLGDSYAPHTKTSNLLRFFLIEVITSEISCQQRKKRGVSNADPSKDAKEEAKLIPAGIKC